MNWSKKLSVMVSFRALFLAFPCFEKPDHWGNHGIGSWEVRW